MAYKPRSLFRLIEDINTSLFLPHIQRPFVWDEDQMRRLFDSLMRNYPIQTLLFWRTRAAIKARRFMASVEWDAVLSDLYDKPKSAQGVEKVFVLDGQQRLQTLYALFNGAVQSSDGQHDLEAYIDITSGHTQGDDGLLYRLMFEPAPPGLPMYRLRNLMDVHAQKNAEEISDELNEALDQTWQGSMDQQKARQKLVRRNVSQLASLLLEEKHFWVEELDGVANEYPYRRVLDIFVRVNSGGTKLDAADLMFAAMKEGWSEIEENVEDIVDMLNNDKLSFDKNVVLKCIVVALGQGAELDPDRFATAAGEQLLQTIKDQWPLIASAFNQLRDFITNDLKLYSDKVVRSYNSFVPLFDYLYHNSGPKPRDFQLMVGYYHKSQLFNWYGRQTDGIINVMHGYVGQELPGGFPLEAITGYFEGRGLSGTLQQDHLLDIRLRFMILNLLYVHTFGFSPFNVRYKGNEPHIDHIYPQSSLRNRLILSTGEINHLGNYRYIGATENIRKRAELPIEYFGRLKSEGVPIEKHLLLPDVSADPNRLAFDIPTYRDFRDRRLKAIFEIANKVVNPEMT